MKEVVSTWLLLIVLTSAFSALSEQAPPGCPNRPRTEQAAKEEAKHWFSNGEALFGQEKYAEALVSFQCSQWMFSHRATIYNASQAALFAGNKKLAMELMKQYLSAAPKGEKAAEIRRSLAELAATMQPEPEQEKPQPAAKSEPSSETLSETPPPTSPESQPEEQKKRLGLAPLIVAAAATAGLGVTTLVLNFKVGERFDAAEESEDPADQDSAQSLQVAERVFFGLTLAGAATAVVLLFFTDFKKDKPEGDTALSALGPLVSEQGAGLVFAKEF